MDDGIAGYQIKGSLIRKCRKNEVFVYFMLLSKIILQLWSLYYTSVVNFISQLFTKQTQIENIESKEHTISFAVNILVEFLIRTWIIISICAKRSLLYIYI